MVFHNHEFSKKYLKTRTLSCWYIDSLMNTAYTHCVLQQHAEVNTFSVSLKLISYDWKTGRGQIPEYADEAF